MSSATEELPFRNVNYQEMRQLVDMYESEGRQGSGLVVWDVRTAPEIAATGSLSPSTINSISLQELMQENLLALSEEDFFERTGVDKPTLDESIVFSCAAGIRSVYACQTAAAAGYTNLINYTGGSNEWFSV